MCFYILFWLARLIKKILFPPLCLFFLSGCYNNSHIRTSKILEKGESVVSFNGSLNIAPEESIGYVSTYDNFWNVYTGLAGLRGELSILRGYKNSEAGLYSGFGMGGCLRNTRGFLLRGILV